MRLNTPPKLLSIVAAFAGCQAATAGSLALVGGTLIDGTGHPPIAHSVVLNENGTIQSVGTLGTVRIPTHFRKIDTTHKTVLPGLINVHVHFTSAGHNDYARWDREFPEARIKAEIFPAAAKALLASGVTTVRDLGGDIDDLLWLRYQVRSGKLPGPRILIAGPFLCTPKRQFSGSISSGGKYWVVQSPEDGRAKVQELVRRQVDVIKLWDDQFTLAEFAAVISEAHAHGLHVAAHLLTLEGIENAVASGMAEGDTLEHIGAGPGARYPDDLVQMIVSRKVYVSPTVIAFDGLRQIVADPKVLDDPTGRSMLPRAVYADILDSLRNADPKQNPIYQYVFVLNKDRESKLRQLHDAGATFALGTDSGSRANPHHMTEWREMVLLHDEAGLTNMQVIESATRIAAQALNQSDHVGTLEVGKIADIVIVDGNPLVQMSDMRRVAHVIQGGALIDLH